MNAPWKDGAWIEARKALLGQRRALATGLALTLVNRLSAMAVPASSKWVIDDVVGKQRGDLLPWLAAGAGAAVLLEAGSAFALSQVTGIASERAVARLRRQTQRRVVGLPVGFFDQQRTGALMSRIMVDAEGVRSIAGSGLIGLVSGALTAMLALGVLFHLNPGLTGVLVVVLIGLAVGLAVGFGRLYPAFQRASEAAAETTGRLAEALGGIRVVKAYAAERREAEVFTRGSHRLLRSYVRALTGASIFTAGSTLAVGMTAVMLMMVGGLAVVHGSMTVGELVMYVFFAALLAMPLVQISANASEIGKAWAGLGRIHQLTSLETEAEEDAGRAPVPGVTGSVDFRDVSYGYGAEKLVLKHVTLRAEAGATVALVGPTGSGKSTVCRLLAAFDRPTSGRVLVDGRDLAGVRRRAYRQHLGMVLQETFLFDGTIAENIRYGAPGAADTALHAAARLAHCEEFIRRLPDGYDTRIGERGVKLSGGQRQRVAIARALLKDPRILIFDEATSHLDSESEALIQDGLRALRRGRTTFVIAHRLSTVRDADEILVLEGGEIVERGKHEELLAVGRKYAMLVRIQTGFARCCRSDVSIGPGSLKDSHVIG
ncbi:MAG: ABC transporter ATP-binding protein [Gemmatimonadales bacterium]